MSTTKTKSQNASARKRILSVTIRRIIDDSPDTSYLGEYGNRPKTEYAIDRAHSEDCDSVQPGIELDGDWTVWNGTAEEALERVRAFLEGLEECQHAEYQELFCDACRDEVANKEAIETVWELEKNAGECDCHGGNMERGQYRYFNGPVENYKGESPADIRKYIRQDYERMESLNRGDWCYIGIRAEAQVQTGSDVVQEITSGGLWGIESESGREHIEETIREELANLKTELLALGFSKRAIASAFKNIREKND